MDDLKTERAMLKERLSQQLALRGVEADILGFESGEAFLAAEKERRFTAAFLDIYMEGLSGMDAAKELRKTDTDCLLIFTTTSTDLALEGFQVRALHYLVKPFSEEELSGLLTEMLAK
ncbi:LytR/AlgR family response regulator transcription factor, partial [Flavonifractor plautii]|uniref:LytR/AlgR family response regulator transcription factor n=1 Tax=Flavonifractor plautii TaxID=292800 RepID=UPI0035216EC0